MGSATRKPWVTTGYLSTIYYPGSKIDNEYPRKQMGARKNHTESGKTTQGIYERLPKFTM